VPAARRSAPVRNPLQVPCHQGVGATWGGGCCCRWALIPLSYGNQAVTCSCLKEKASVSSSLSCCSSFPVGNMPPPLPGCRFIAQWPHGQTAPAACWRTAAGSSTSRVQDMASAAAAVAAVPWLANQEQQQQHWLLKVPWLASPSLAVVPAAAVRTPYLELVATAVAAVSATWAAAAAVAAAACQNVAEICVDPRGGLCGWLPHLGRIRLSGALPEHHHLPQQPYHHRSPSGASSCSRLSSFSGVDMHWVGGAAGQLLWLRQWPTAGQCSSSTIIISIVLAAVVES